MDEQTQIKRDIAFKVKIKDIVEGKYVKEEGWKPNYVLTNDGKNIARVNIMGVVVSEPSVEEKNQSLILDDGSDRILLRTFEDGVVLNVFMLGDIVNVVGKPKEYMGTKYILPELIRIVNNKRWLEVRKKELELKDVKPIGQKSELSQTNIQDEDGIVESVVDEDNDIEKVIKLIRSLDSGNGVFMDMVVSKLNKPNAEKILSSLIEQGDIFEVQPGKVKVLE